MKNEELKKLAMYKVEGKDFADDVFSGIFTCRRSFCYCNCIN